MNVTNINPIIFTASVNDLKDQLLFDTAYAAISESRRIKSDKYRFEKERHLSIGAEILLRYAIEYLSFEMPDFEFVYGKYGKPYFKNSKINFSISHSDEYVACALAGCDVGCDIEKVKDINLGIAKRFFTESEYLDIISKPSNDLMNDCFFRYWTLKESFIKATGRGMNIPLGSFSLDINSNRISVTQSVDNKDYNFEEFDVITGYRCALCYSGDKCDTEIHTVCIKDYLTAN